MRGLVPMHAVTATQDEWDEYEWKFCRSVRRHAASSRMIRRCPRCSTARGAGRDVYLKWGREALGFAGLPLLRPGARGG